MNLPLWFKIILGIALVAFIAWRVSNQWRAAGAYSDAMFAEQKAYQDLHARLLHHASWQRLLHGLAARGIHVAMQPQPGAYQLGLLTLWTDMGNTLEPNDPAIRGMNAYLSGPKKIVASIILASGEVHVRDCSFGEWPSAAS